MNPQGFSFPPPPPPPPTQQHQPQQQYPHNPGFAPYGQNRHGPRGGRGGGGGHSRGRGRGYGSRGGGRGGHYMSSDANRPGTYPASTSVAYGAMTYLGYPTQSVPSPQAGISAPPHYAPSPPRSFQSPVNQSSFASPSQYQQPSAHGAPYQHQPGYNTSYSTSTTPQAPAYAQVSSSHQLAVQSVQPTMMGPPMRWGFENTGNSGSFAGLQRLNQRGPRQFNAQNQQNFPGKHANKRDHSSAFGKPQSVVPRIAAPPPVPSFGNPLPSKPPLPVESQRKPKKKKRKHNQLGLTPKTEEHESSEEEDDADEESRLAVSGAGISGPLQVTYRGRTSTLQSSVEIAAWIEERKKRFPTQAKIDEKKKAMEEAKKAREEAQRQHKQATARAKKEQETRGPKKQSRHSLDPADTAAKAKRKAEKLRRKLMKEEKRIAQAEADAELARKLEESQKGSLDANTGSTPPAQEVDKVSGLDAHGQEMQNMLAEPDPGPALIGAEIGSESRPEPEKLEPSGIDNDHAINDSAWDTSSTSDWTSSSGSDLSSSDSEESDDDSPPEQATTRRDGPERVPPPAREDKKRVCRHFARNGRCSRGNKCKFLHEKPQRGLKTKPAEKGRKGLLQALFDRQKEDENRKLMETIIWMGENGLLDESTDQTNVTVGSTASNSASGAHNHIIIEHPPPSEETAHVQETSVPPAIM